MPDHICIDCAAPVFVRYRVPPKRCDECRLALKKVKARARYERERDERSARIRAVTAQRKANQRPQACGECGLLFVARRPRFDKFCSQECSRRNTVSSGRQREYTQRYYAKDGNRRRWSITCQMCGVKAKVTQSDVKFCSHDCSVLWRLENPLLDPNRWQGRKISTSLEVVPLGSVAEFPDPREMVDRPCVYCLSTMHVQRWSHKRYCSEGCADRWKKFGRVRRFDDGRTWQFLVAGPCSWCDENFTATASEGATSPRFCSKRCLKDADRSRRGRFVVPRSVRQQIYVRDGFVCQLCKVAVDMTLGSSDTWGATLDHVIPQSHQLVPDHSPANLRLAHRYCNSIRGDLSFIDDSFFQEAS